MFQRAHLPLIALAILLGFATAALPDYKAPTLDIVMTEDSDPNITIEEEEEEEGEKSAENTFNNEFEETEESEEEVEAVADDVLPTRLVSANLPDIGSPDIILMSREPGNRTSATSGEKDSGEVAGNIFI